MSSNNNNNKFYSLGSFRVEIPSVVHNANVNPQNFNIITQNGNYTIPENYTGWNDFRVNVQPPEPQPQPVDDNEINITLPADPDFNEDDDPYTLTIEDFDDENNPLITWNQFNEKYATSINLDLGAFVEKLFNDLKLENGQAIIENGEYQIYDYEKDDDLDIKKKVLRVSRDVIDDPSYRNIGTFVVNVPTSGNLQNNKQVRIYDNGYNYIQPDSGFDGLSGVGVTVQVATSNTDNEIKYWRFEYPTTDGDTALSDYNEFGVNMNYPKTITNNFTFINDHNLICVSQVTKWGIIGNDSVWYSFRIIRNKGTEYQLQNNINHKMKVWSFNTPSKIDWDQFESNNSTHIYFYDNNRNLIGSNYPFLTFINLSNNWDVYIVDSWSASDFTINAASISGF